jgi:hypothetical protein
MAGEVEVVRVVTFDTITMEDGEWAGPDRDEDVMSYKAKIDGCSLTVKRGGGVVFDSDYKKGAEIRIVGNVIHLPEGASGI